MTIPSHGKQSRLPPPRQVRPCDQIRFPLLSEAIDNAERFAKVPRSPYMMSISSHEDSCSSWEAGVLAEDASVQLAAGIWPPPAYPCSFCGREFRSAQALGGHMNVHRHDRARLHCSSLPPPSHGFSPLVATSQAPFLLPHHKYLANLFAEYTNETLMELKIPPIPLSVRNNLPAAMRYTSLSAGCPSDNSTSLPLRLQQLASEGAASLLQYPHLQQRCTSSDLLSFMPPPIANCITVSCHSSKPRAIMKKNLIETVTLPSSTPSPPSSNASSCTSLSSVIDATSREKGFSIFEVEECSFIENDQNHLFRHIITGSKSSEETLNAPDAPKAYTQADINSSCMMWTKKAFTYACGNPSGADVDLDLRLGRKPP